MPLSLLPTLLGATFFAFQSAFHPPKALVAVYLFRALLHLENRDEYYFCLPFIGTFIIFIASVLFFINHLRVSIHYLLDVACRLLAVIPADALFS